MHHQNKWLIVSTIFLTNFFVVGSASSITGIFVTPLVTYFGWSRTRVSALTMMLALTSAVCGPVVGWLLDTIDAGKVVSSGVLVMAAALLLAGHANSFGALAVAHVMMGVGTALGAMIPAAVVVSNWFDAKRGIALGIAMAPRWLEMHGRHVVARRILPADLAVCSRFLSYPPVST